MRVFISLICFFLLLSNVHADQVDQRIRWDKTPIPISLQTNASKDMRMDFSYPIIDVRIQSSLLGKLRSENFNNTIYWKALADFPPTRIQVVDNQGQVILFDVSASETAMQTPIVLVVTETHNQQPSHYEQPGNVTKPASITQLTRFAAQHFYGPERLIQPVQGVARTPVNDTMIDDFLMGMDRNNTPYHVSAKPLAAWRSHQYYITAVQLINLSDRSVDLDPRNFRGQFISSAFLNSQTRLHSAGSIADSTVVFLIAKKPFSGTLL
jgi:integrating conjugative element protein (TIGR03749 family)